MNYIELYLRSVIDNVTQGTKFASCFCSENTRNNLFMGLAFLPLILYYYFCYFIYYNIFQGYNLVRILNKIAFYMTFVFKKTKGEKSFLSVYLYI